MGRLLSVTGSSVANNGLFVGAACPTTGNQKKRMYLHSIDVCNRLDWAAAVDLYLFNTYTGLSAEKLTAPNLVPTFSSTAAYDTSLAGAWDTDADDWVDTGADNPTVARAATIGGRADCLKITDVGGTDAIQIGRPATRVAATFYKITFEAFYETGGGVGAGAAFWGVGKTTACTTNALTRNGGNNQATGADNAWEDVVLYSDAGANTALDIALFTADNGATGAAFTGAGKYVAIRNLKIYAMTNQTAWTHGTADDDFLWDFRNAEADKIVNNTTALTSNQIGGAVAGDLYLSGFTHVRSATGVTVTFGGTTIDADPAAGTFADPFVVTTTGASNLVFTADATLVGTIDTCTLKKVGGCNVNTLYGKYAIPDVQTVPKRIEFHTKQPYSTSGWGVYATTGGAAVVMDITMLYEVV